jgi:hypothetical protein
MWRVCRELGLRIVDELDRDCRVALNWQDATVNRITAIAVAVRRQHRPEDGSRGATEGRPSRPVSASGAHGLLDQAFADEFLKSRESGDARQPNE